MRNAAFEEVDDDEDDAVDAALAADEEEEEEVVDLDDRAGALAARARGPGPERESARGSRGHSTGDFVP